MKKLIVASNNKGKIKEIKELLKDFYRVYSMAEAGFLEEIDETGETFFDNALLKAQTVSSALGADALSDDSGLMVESLGGAPGVYSARYSGENATDEKNNELLLKNMKDIADRRAKFFSCVVLARTDGTFITGEGFVEGEILYAPVGTGGFGYDPLFFCGELAKSFGEASDTEKNSVSHRARALDNLLKKLRA